MPKSTRRGGRTGRVDVIEVFSPRRSGPWHLLRPLRTRLGIAFVVILVLVLLARHQLAFAELVVVLDLTLIVASFSALWLLIGLVIRARAELVLLGGGWATDYWLSSLLGPVWAGVTLASVLALALGVRPIGRHLTSRAWCVLDRHRLRLCLRQTKVRTMNMDGSLPLLLWARPTAIGERVWLWVRAGSSPEDIEDALEYIAPACYARSARTQAVRRLTTLVVLDIIRRDPLSKSTPITSPLARLTSLVTGAVRTEGTEAITPASIDEITREGALDTASRGRRSKKPGSPGTPESSDAPAVTPVQEDYSDYIDID